MDSEEPQQPAVGEPAGQQLRQIREKLGLSQKDVADAQHLRVFIIQAIEEGNYDQIDSELFLKGYVRAYAKQVGADADSLIQSLDIELEPLRRQRAQQEQENPLVDLERRRRKKKQVAKTLFIILVLGGLALAGWKLILEPGTVAEAPADEGAIAPEQDKAPAEDGMLEETSADGSEATEVSESSVGTMPENAQEQTGGAEPLASPEPLDNPEPVDSSPEPLVSSELLDSSEPSDSPEALDSPELTNNVESLTASEPSNEPVGTSPAVAAVEPVIQPDPVFEESAQPTSVAATTQLEMSFVADCWVQVTDASGARLVASLQRNGDQVRVSGRAPFNVVIGAVDAVDEVSFGGEPVDLSSFRVVNNRTEFTLTL
ncbi:RodZ domain-containing protein [Marinobacter confluentis]|uniref:DUF4115 domain-containing protein n=1 Tax=Marinobacter confluentis TaxID=1697557 RepID=A0A4Z1CCG4_9GAMM|nr:RodZ domain-containing protein [Marinobacter confluentis]TGN41793.1 DUF4115 domain-containing protein [Marinobacter confluentis]